jgi:hypothetical protein
MKSKGFVSLLGLIWFGAVLAFVLNSSRIMQQYLLIKENIILLQEQSQVETQAILIAKRMFSDMDEENYCDFIGEYEVCYRLFNDEATINIDYPTGQKTITINYEWDCNCLIEIRRKVDK